MIETSIVSPRARFLTAFAIALASAVLCHIAVTTSGPSAGDFGWTLRSLRDLFSGRDPYAYPVNPLAVPYPLPAAFVGLPFLLLPDPWAAACFFGLSSGTLAYGLLRTGPAWRLLLFATPLYLHSLMYAQWPPLTAAMAFFPSLLFLIIVKPHMALAMALSGHVRWTRRGVALTLLFLIASFIALVDWPLRWLSELGPYQGVIPLTVLSAGGPLVLLALLRWRTRESRLLLLMAAMPQRMFYDQLSLWLIPGSIRQMLFVTAVSWLGAFLWLATRGGWAFWIVASLYLPMLICVLVPSFATISKRTGVTERLSFLRRLRVRSFHGSREGHHADERPAARLGS